MDDEQKTTEEKTRELKEKYPNLYAEFVEKQGVPEELVIKAVDEFEGLTREDLYQTLIASIISIAALELSMGLGEALEEFLEKKEVPTA